MAHHAHQASHREAVRKTLAARYGAGVPVPGPWPAP